MPRFPRARGDRPWNSRDIEPGVRVSPRPRGSTVAGGRQAAGERGFPAPAGIDPASGGPRVPRARGDRPGRRATSRRISTVSPRPRGSTPSTSGRCSPRPGFPAPAGIDPSSAVALPINGGFPRARGDRPCSARMATISSMVSPRPRGSTRSGPEHGREQAGFPAPAGIDPKRPRTPPRRAWFPRARGDRPLRARPPPALPKVSPRPRGSTTPPGSLRARHAGFPAPAGIDPRLQTAPRSKGGFPRARGDRPGSKTSDYAVAVVSPRPRGSTRPCRPDDGRQPGFPAPAGIDPECRPRRQGRPGFPRARGDRPLRPPRACEMAEVSPRPRGSTPDPHPEPPAAAGFPAPAGIDLNLAGCKVVRVWFPRARGDRPSTAWRRTSRRWVSPRPRGSTRSQEPTEPGKEGFPAPAGIDPLRCWRPSSGGGFPRARGDRPGQHLRAGGAEAVSPRPRGSTPSRGVDRRRDPGFPAPAGIDPSSSRVLGFRRRFPRARGDRPGVRAAAAANGRVSPRPRGSTPPCRPAGRRRRGFADSDEAGHPFRSKPATLSERSDEWGSWLIEVAALATGGACGVCHVSSSLPGGM